MKHNKKKRHDVENIQVVVTEQEPTLDLVENTEGVMVHKRQVPLVEAIDFLEPHCLNCANATEVLDENGWGLAINKDDALVLNAQGNPAFASIIPTVAYAFNADYTKVKSAPTLIVQTKAGFVHVAPDDSKKDTLVLGPVVNPCIIGTPTQPVGIFIPFLGGQEAMIQGQYMLDSFIDMKAAEEMEADCDCGGKCGNNCKCHEEDATSKMDFTGKELLW